MLSPATSSVGPSLLCRVRGWFCALPLGYVQETMRPLPLESLTSPSFVQGLSIIRGTPTPMLDAGALLGAADAPRSTRLVVLRLDGRRVALAVEEVLGVRTIPAASLDELLPLLRNAGREIVSAVGALDAELLIVLQASHLVPESVWNTISAEAGSR